MEHQFNEKYNEEKNKRIEKRKLKGTINGFIYIDMDFNSKSKYKSVIKVMNPLEEKLCMHNCNSIYDVVSTIPVICNQYNIKQVFIDIHDFNAAMVDALISDERIIDDDIDIVPMRALKMFN